MKRTIIIHAIISVYTVLDISGVICQPIQGVAVVTPRIAEIDTPKDNRDFYPLMGKNSPNNIKVLRSFLKDFKDAKNVSWFRAINGGCAAQFIKDSAQITVRYSSNGTWNYTLKRYAEKHMPADLRTLVKRSFFDHAIQEVVEITIPNEEDIIYRIMIKNDEGFKILIICRGEMQVIGEYSNSIR